MSAPFRFGLIGGGRMGRTHLRGLEGSTEVEIVAVTEPDESAAASLREQGLSVFPTADEMFADCGARRRPDRRADTTAHRHHSQAALEAGLPVLCEKPFGLVPDDARAAGVLASEKGLALQIAYWRRFVPQLSALRSDLADGKYGNCPLLGVFTVGRGPAAAVLPQRQRRDLHRHGCARNRPDAVAPRPGLRRSHHAGLPDDRGSGRGRPTWTAPRRW